MINLWNTSLETGVFAHCFCTSQYKDANIASTYLSSATIYWLACICRHTPQSAVKAWVSGHLESRVWQEEAGDVGEAGMDVFPHVLQLLVLILWDLYINTLWLWFQYFHILALPYFHILTSWPLIFSPESSFLLLVHRKTHMESSSPAPERSLTCVKAHRKWVLMFIYSSIMHIKVFHNDSFMKNSLFQKRVQKTVSRNIQIQQIPEMVWGKFLPWPVCRIQWKAIKVNKNKSRVFFVFFFASTFF